jgi:hypothetical protein
MAVDLVTKSCEKVARPIFEKVATAVSFAMHCNMIFAILALLLTSVRNFLD